MSLAAVPEQPEPTDPIPFPKLAAEVPLTDTDSVPPPTITADSDGVRIYFPTDDHEYTPELIIYWITRATAGHPGVVLDYAEAFDGGLIFDFMYPGKVL